MKCSFCGFNESKVIDSRTSGDGESIRRRRECLSCQKRFTTYEVIERTPIFVVKNGGARQAFDPAKIKAGIVRACEKRPVAMHQIDALVGSIEREISGSLEQEIPTKKIGEMVMLRLKELDHVAYIRFASVYRQFRDVTTFLEFLNEFQRHQT